jgi:hypothetical protein
MSFVECSDLVLHTCLDVSTGDDIASRMAFKMVDWKDKYRLQREKQNLLHER